jgi:uncharacterized membrane protein
MNINYSNIKLIPAIISWGCLIFSYYYTVQEPVENIYMKTIIFTLGIYGVYNATNLAILQNYTTEIAIRDTIWGTSLFLFVTFIFNFF